MKLRIYYHAQHTPNEGNLFKILPNGCDELEAIFEIEEALTYCFQMHPEELIESFVCTYNWNPTNLNYWFVEGESIEEIIDTLKADILVWARYLGYTEKNWQISWRENIIKELEK